MGGMGIEEKLDLESEGEIEAVKIQEIPIPKDMIMIKD